MSKMFGDVLLRSAGRDDLVGINFNTNLFIVTFYRGKQKILAEAFGVAVKRLLLSHFRDRLAHRFYGAFGKRKRDVADPHFDDVRLGVLVFIVSRLFRDRFEKIGIFKLQIVFVDLHMQTSPVNAVTAPPVNKTLSGV